MNTKRKLYVLRAITPGEYEEHEDLILQSGFALIYSFTGPNDEPPYVSVTFWGKGRSPAVYEEDGEYSSLYVIRESDADSFIAMKNAHQNEYLDWHNEGTYTRQAGEHSLRSSDYARIGMQGIRKPKVRIVSFDALNLH